MEEGGCQGNSSYLSAFAALRPWREDHQSSPLGQAAKVAQPVCPPGALCFPSPILLNSVILSKNPRGVSGFCADNAVDEGRP